MFQKVAGEWVRGPTTACTRLPTARIVKHTLPANKPLVGGCLAGPAAGEAEALAGMAPSTLLTIALAAVYPKQTLESSVEFRDCARTRDVSIICGLRRVL
jgi:hypothetical protein